MAPTTINCLPEELIQMILSRLPSETVSKARFVSKLWNEVIASESFLNDFVRNNLGMNNCLISLNNNKISVFNMITLEKIKDLFGNFKFLAAFKGLVLIEETKEIKIWNVVVNKTCKIPDLPFEFNSFEGLVMVDEPGYILSGISVYKYKIVCYRRIQSELRLAIHTCGEVGWTIKSLILLPEVRSMVCDIKKGHSHYSDGLMSYWFNKKYFAKSLVDIKVLIFDFMKEEFCMEYLPDFTDIKMYKALFILKGKFAVFGAGPRYWCIRECCEWENKKQWVQILKGVSLPALNNFIHDLRFWAIKLLVVRLEYIVAACVSNGTLHLFRIPIPNLTELDFSKKSHEWSEIGSHIDDCAEIELLQLKSLEEFENN